MEWYLSPIHFDNVLLCKFWCSTHKLLFSPVGCRQLSCGFEHPVARGSCGGKPSVQKPAGQARSHEHLYSRHVPVSRTQILLPHIRPHYGEPNPIDRGPVVIIKKTKQIQITCIMSITKPKLIKVTISTWLNSTCKQVIVSLMCTHYACSYTCV